MAAAAAQQPGLGEPGGSGKAALPGRLAAQADARAQPRGIAVFGGTIVLHGGLGGGEPIHVRVRLGPTSLCLKVIDEGAGFAAAAERAEADATAAGGRGLGIVDRLALDWAWERVDDRTVVWAELPRGTSTR